MQLYRAMTPAPDGLPVVGRSARWLGVRPPAEVRGGHPDVPATEPAAIVNPGVGGMSVAPDDPAGLSSFRRPPALGGTGKDPVWEIDSDDLGSDLQFRLDTPAHGLIEPARPITLAEFEAALAATRGRWVRYAG